MSDFNIPLIESWAADDGKTIFNKYESDQPIGFLLRVIEEESDDLHIHRWHAEVHLMGTCIWDASYDANLHDLDREGFVSTVMADFVLDFREGVFGS